MKNEEDFLIVFSPCWEKMGKMVVKNKYELTVL